MRSANRPERKNDIMMKKASKKRPVNGVPTTDSGKVVKKARVSGRGKAVVGDGGSRKVSPRMKKVIKSATAAEQADRRRDNAMENRRVDAKTRSATAKGGKSDGMPVPSSFNRPATPMSGMKKKKPAVVIGGKAKARKTVKSGAVAGDASRKKKKSK